MNCEYTPQLPTFYNRVNQMRKFLTYFFTILYDLDTLVMSIVCMPNGELEPIYKEDVLAAGKT